MICAQRETPREILYLYMIYNRPFSTLTSQHSASLSQNMRFLTELLLRTVHIGISPTYVATGKGPQLLPRYAWHGIT